MSTHFLDKIQWEWDKRLIQSDGFIPYCQAYCRRNELVMSPHQIYMANMLEKAMTTPNSRLMIKMPPGHAKSTYASILAPTYYLGRFPKKIVIMTTHTQDFSDDWGRTCRRIINDEEYQYTFNTSLRKDSQAVSRFELENGSKYYGASIVGNITGKRANLAIGDDWLRGIKDADSEVVRQSIWKAYIWDLKSRLSPNASIILIGTPWHEDDHFGKILLSKDKDNWDVIEMPAIIETQYEKDNDVLGRDFGEPLWPEYITKEMLTDIKDGLDKEDMRMWNSLFQVKPTFEGGGYFKREWLKTISRLPSGLSYYGGSDYAVSAGKGDYTVHAIIGYDPKNDDMYIVHIWREQAESNVWVDEFIELVEHYEPLVWAEESGQILKSLDPYIQKSMQNRRYVMREQFSSTIDKTARARAFQAYMASGNVYILDRAWTEPLMKELLAFPSGKYDDQVDALSLVSRMLRDMYKTVEKDKKLAEYDYRDGKVILPGLEKKISTNSPAPYTRF